MHILHSFFFVSFFSNPAFSHPATAFGDCWPPFKPFPGKIDPGTLTEKFSIFTALAPGGAWGVNVYNVKFDGGVLVMLYIVVEFLVVGQKWSVLEF